MRVATHSGAETHCWAGGRGGTVPVEADGRGEGRVVFLKIIKLRGREPMRLVYRM